MLYQEQLNTLEFRLSEVKKEASGPMQEAVACIKICRDCLDMLRKLVDEDGFESKKEEIHFFKNVKSWPLGLLIYYTEVRSCQMGIPQWNLQAKLDFIRSEMNRINLFLDKNLDFRFYMENGETQMDKVYFTRKHLNEAPPSISIPYFRDSSFNTSHDYLWGLIKGFKQYGDYLNALEGKTKAESEKEPKTEDIEIPYRFTKPATAAMELIYAMKYGGFINYGDFEIKGFVEFFSKTFGLDIRDPYGLFKQIAQRKSNPVKYLNMLSEALLAELEARDEYIP